MTWLIATLPLRFLMMANALNIVVDFQHDY